jgi:hypothetical protein
VALFLKLVVTNLESPGRRLKQLRAAALCSRASSLVDLNRSPRKGSLQLGTGPPLLHGHVSKP